MKKLLIILTVSLLIVFSFAGCEKEEEKLNIVLNVKTPALQMNALTNDEIVDSYTFLKSIATLFEERYDKANVTVNVMQFEKSKENREILESFNTPRATDVLYEEFFNMSTYIHSGKVVPLDDIITDEIRNDIDDSYWENGMLNGKTYMIPYLGMQNTLCYNKDLFRQVGLDKYIADEDIIQNWTLDEWDEILSTLKAKLPKNVYPMMMYAANSMGDTHIITLLRSHGSKFFDENGRIHINTPEGIAAIQWLMDYNEKGYFPTNAETLEIDDCGELFYNKQLAIHINNVALDATLRKCGFDYGHVNFPSIDGDGFNSTFMNGFEVFDNDDAEKLAVAKDFVKFVYETEELLDYSAGSIPVSNRVAKKFANELVSRQKYIDNSKNGWNFTANNPAWRDVRAVFYPNISDLLEGEMTAEEIAIQIEETCNAAIEKGYAESVLHD